ncbi:hypothetical protein SEA_NIEBRUSAYLOR_115 [Mycobacterium phage NiebruSaylor]|uniref:Uncharacterized protein n=1 Tax=Mycobacterium phage Catdawg TaxID=1340819 RepID=S5Y3M6_9CAUD|nr:hypothetical protein PBI_CATDAWG_116 [Mycobacterium phage Catdawg]AYQ98952.1 hypothetical protein SEA_VORRPS_115 [Mycobacterium phage Vorrps]QOC59313.1 hypothetical protein SEA_NIEBRUSAYLOR_115 [Mycobacterium phage NiebruSaylor]QWY81600.1 hypothetical protein SEA_WINGET_115 [Mycobacterium phage Winget]QXO13487.1 hypothetical protein SEA_MURAI_115 [Mycobacterium phage Murai]UAW08466.1 hypothetical protein SEA_MORI_115 [Mycobacterium phage Mori]
MAAIVIRVGGQRIEVPDGYRVKWPLCENCGHGRSCHTPDKGVGWRCRYRRKRQRCGCMRWRGIPQVVRACSETEHSTRRKMTDDR